MKKRAAVLISSFLLLLLAILVIQIFLEFSRPYYSSPDETREWARAGYEKTFTNVPAGLPTLAHSAPPILDLNVSANRIEAGFQNYPSDEDNIEYFGDILKATPGSNSVALPNGQVVELVGVALRESPLSIKSASKEIVWHDPISLSLISDPASVGRPKKMYISAGKRDLMIALRCNGSDPVRWNWPQVRDATTLGQIQHGASSRTQDDLYIVEFKLSIYHDTELDIVVPVAWGEPEYHHIDPTKTNAEVTFSNGPASLRFFFSQDGHQTSTSYSGGGSKVRNGWDWGKPEKKWHDKSFACFLVWPAVHGYMMEYRLPAEIAKGKLWKPFHQNNAMGIIRLPTAVAGIDEIEIRHFPNTSRVLFHLAGIPELPDVENLFDVELPAMEFKYESDFERAIAGPTEMRWVRRQSISSHNFPIKFEAGLTPADLLKEYMILSGERVYVEEETHQLTSENDSVWQTARDWLENTRKRLFP